MVPDNEAHLFEDSSYRGRSIVLKDGFRGNVDQFDFDDTMSSFKIGRKVRVKFCRNRDCGNANIDTVSEVMGPFNQDSMPDRNNWLSYVEVSTYDEEKNPMVMVLGEVDFDLDSAALLPPGKYLSSELYHKFYVNMGDRHHSPSSIVVPAKLTAHLYPSDNFEGTPLVIQGPVRARLGDDAYKMDNKVRSIIVTKTDSVAL